MSADIDSRPALATIEIPPKNIASSFSPMVVVYQTGTGMEGKDEGGGTEEGGREEVELSN